MSNVTWIEARSHAWMSDRVSAKVAAFARDFMSTYGWARSMELEERFTDTGINVKVPRVPPYQPPEDATEFLQRPGDTALVVRVTRDRDSRVFECSAVFVIQNQTPDVAIDQMLTIVGQSLVVSERQAR